MWSSVVGIQTSLAWSGCEGISAAVSAEEQFIFILFVFAGLTYRTYSNCFKATHQGEVKCTTSHAETSYLHVNEN